jgi:uncharacterized protein YkwD
MKAKLLRVLLLVAMITTIISCSPEAQNSASTTNVSSTSTIAEYTYSTFEMETMALINEYRVSKGLNTLKTINYISVKSEEHNNDMIAVNTLSHDGFVTRSEAIMKVLGATNVGENVAYNYASSQSAFNAWLNSPGHKANIEGNFTDFGMSIRLDAAGRKYYTNIFAKI